MFGSWGIVVVWMMVMFLFVVCCMSCWMLKKIVFSESLLWVMWEMLFVLKVRIIMLLFEIVVVFLF